MPGPQLHLRLTARWAEEEGLSAADSAAVGLADYETDALWPGRRHPWRHFNPTATLVFAPLHARRARRLRDAGTPEAHAMALTYLGRSLHARQDGLGHGLLGLAHIRYRLGLLGREPDDWEGMPPRLRERIERATRAGVRRYLRGGM